MNNSPPGPPLRLVDVRPRGGNRQHFYHFFFGVLLPLCRYLARTTDDYVPMIVRSCGPLDVMLHELQLPRLMLAEKNGFDNIATTFPNELLQKVALTGFDIGKTVPIYDHEGIVEGRAALLRRLRIDINKHRAQLTPEWADTPRVLIVDRGPPDPFYRTWLSRAREPGAGASRRRVGNHEEMVAGVRKSFHGTQSVLLEGKPLSAQIALFQLADVVVAQHGAALANMIWMKPGAGVIELNGGGAAEPYFSGLAPLFGLAYRSFGQDGPFGPVDPSALTNAIGELIAQRPDGRATPAMAAATTQ